ncbi:hypothetical protein E4U31_007332 [Claviceps sp. LM219 group G6]|nr:hypothetical protein E4U31_007332 [Claviceps sp. LM219 group G6]
MVNIEGAGSVLQELGRGPCVQKRRRTVAQRESRVKAYKREAKYVSGFRTERITSLQNPRGVGSQSSGLVPTQAATVDINACPTNLDEPPQEGQGPGSITKALPTR